MKAKIAWIVTEIGYGNPILVFSEPGAGYYAEVDNFSVTNIVYF